MDEARKPAAPLPYPVRVGEMGLAHRYREPHSADPQLLRVIVQPVERSAARVEKIENWLVHGFAKRRRTGAYVSSGLSPFSMETTSSFDEYGALIIEAAKPSVTTPALVVVAVDHCIGQLSTLPACL